MNKPVFFMDLDDTLFQTKRKMSDAPEQKPWRVGAVDRTLEPRSFMNEEQAMLVDWLLAHADLIPVTARGTEEISRVQIAFTSWAITTHGAVVLTPDGKEEQEWSTLIQQKLAAYRPRILDIQERITTFMARQNINGWARINYEYQNTPVYLVMKHRDSTRVDELNAIGDEIEYRMDIGGFYVHRNDNNIALLPDCIEKGLATEFLLHKLRTERGNFPVIGMGDSLSDYRFLKLCSWFGMPKQGQFAEKVATAIFNRER